MNLKGVLALAVGALMLGTAGCQKTTPPTLPSMSIEYNGTSSTGDIEIKDIAVAGTNISVTVSSNRSWSGTTAADWVTVTPNSGAADSPAAVELTVAANTGAARSAEVVFTTGDGLIKRTVKLAQLGENIVNVGDITITEIRAMYSGSDVTITEDKTLVATVISDGSDQGGNSTSLKNIVISDADAGITVRLAENSTYAKGDELTIKVKDLLISHYGGSVQLTQGTTGVPTAAITKTGTGNAVTAKPITAAQLISGAFESQYVAVADVQFTSDFAGKQIGTDAAHATSAMESKNGETFVTFVSKYSKFITQSHPNGSGVMKGIAGVNNGNIQLLPQTYADYDGLTGERFAEAPAFSVSPLAVNISDDGGNATVNVTGNVAWTAAITSGGGNITSGPTPASGNGAGTITVVFPANTDTANEKVVTMAVSTTADVATKSYTVTFTQEKKTDTPPTGNLLFPGSDFNDWDTFRGALNSYGVTNAVQSATGGRNGSGALHINSTPTSNAYVFTALQPNPAPAITKTISFYIKGTAASKSLSMNVYKANGTNYHCFNLDVATSDVTLTASSGASDTVNGTNSYTGSINTGGNWVKVTLNVEGLSLNTGTTGSIFALKVGKDSAYDLYVDDIMFE